MIQSTSGALISREAVRCSFAEAALRDSSNPDHQAVQAVLTSPVFDPLEVVAQ